MHEANKADELKDSIGRINRDEPNYCLTVVFFYFTPRVNVRSGAFNSKRFMMRILSPNAPLSHSQQTHNSKIV